MDRRSYRRRMKISLLEELLLIAYSDEGTLVTTSDTLNCGLAGGVLMELLLAGRVTVQNGRVTVLDPSSTEDPLLDGALARIKGASRLRRPRDWVTELRGGLQEQVLNRLVQRGVLRQEQDRVLWIFPRTRYPSATGDEPAVETDARRRLRSVLDGATRSDPRTAALCALVAATGLDKEVFGDLPEKERKRRLAAVVEQSWPDRAVQQAIKQLASETSTMIAATAATTAATAATTTIIINS